ncbi:MAG TPA: ATP-dependent DNA ligase [Actinomycetes bacterium]|nr:ATP-dependent DNA ligase [Actinomycetes bacterium]
MTPTTLRPPISPMLAKATTEVPEGNGYLYEPKWDGFRCLLFVGDSVEVSGRSESLTRYFPEIVRAASEQLPSPMVLDGELVVASGSALDFEVLAQRIHPAESRITMLSETTPSWYVAFDLLEDPSGVHIEKPFAERRARLEAAAASWKSPFFLTPATADVNEAREWFEQFEGAGMDGVMAKPVDDAYAPGKRTLTKVKHKRTADCVVAGYREHKSGGVVGSLLLGLYDDEGNLQHMGVCGSFSAARRKELIDELAPYVTTFDEHPWKVAVDEAGVRRPGMVNRWNAKKDMSFIPLRPELVVEVAYDQLQGNYRFRHNPRFVRWRPDRDPTSCRFDQLEHPVTYDVTEVLRRSQPG